MNGDPSLVPRPTPNCKPVRAFAGANNGSLHRLYVTEDRWFVRTFNDVNHLDGVMTPEAIRPA